MPLLDMMIAPPILAAAAVQAPSSEREWPVTAGWRIDRFANGCAVWRYDSPGGETVHLALRTDGLAWLTVARPGWTAERGRDYRLRYEIDGRALRPRRVAGTLHDSRIGYAAVFGTELEPAFSAGSTLQLSDDEGVLARLSLAGSASALVIARQCVAAARAALAAGRPVHRGLLLPDPFDPRQPPAPPAPPAPPPPPPPVPGPAALRSGFITMEDYPAAALRAGHSGTVVARYTIGPDGRVLDCAIAQSSGHESLDSTTCILIRRRFRFRPAIDAAGNPAASVYTQRIRWSLPVPPPPPPAKPEAPRRR